MIQKILLSLCIYSLSLIIHAGEGGMGSGGGKGMVCFKSMASAELVKQNMGVVHDELLDDINSIEMIDLIYAKLPTSLFEEKPNIVPLNQGETFKEYLEKIINRIAVTIPNLEFHIRNKGKKMDQNMILRNTPVEQKFDENDNGRYESQKCALTTMAIQHKDAGDYYLDIDYRLFSHPKHSEISKATLILHEYLYLIARERNVTDSRSTRKLIKLLINNDEQVMDEVVLKTYKFGFFSLSPIIRNNGSRSGRIDYTIYSGPVYRIYNMATSAFTHLGHIVKNFQKERAELIVFKLKNLLNKVGVDNSIDHISMGSLILKENKDKLEINFAKEYKELSTKMNIFLKERSEKLKFERENLQGHFSLYYESLDYLSSSQLEVVKNIVDDLARIYEKISQDMTVPNNYSSGREFTMGQAAKKMVRYYPEDFAKRFFYPIDVINADSPNKQFRNLRLLTSMLYQSNSDLGRLNYLDFKIPRL